MGPASWSEVGALVGMVAVVALLVWSRLANLSTSFRHDEAYTVLEFVNRGPRVILFADYHTNNHVLFSLLSWGTTALVGHSEVAYRFWSVVPGLLAVAVLGFWSWRRFAPVAGAAVIVLLTMSALHLELTPQGRGYGLVFLAAAGMLISAVRAADRGRIADLVLFALAGTVGIATYPLFALAFASQAIALLVRRELRWPIIVGSAVYAGAAVLFYGPFWDVITHGSLTTEKSGYDWLDAPFSDLARPSLATVMPDWLANTPSLATIFGLLVVLGGRWLWRRRDRTALLQLTVPVVVSSVALMAFRILHIPRYGSFLLVYVIVLMALGVVELSNLVWRYRALRPLIVLITAALILIGSGNVVEQTRRLPYENFKAVGQIVNRSEIERVTTNSSSPQGLQYYIGPTRLEVQEASALTRLFCYHPGAFIFVDHNFRSADPDLTCLQLRGSAPVHVPQETRGSIDVWLMPAENGAREMPATIAYAEAAFCQAHDDVQNELTSAEPDSDALADALARFGGFAPTEIIRQAREWSRLLAVELFTGERPSGAGFESASDAIEEFCQHQMQSRARRASLDQP
jgi:hypothetical protein